MENSVVTLILGGIIAIAGAIAIITNFRVRNARLYRRAPQPGTAAPVPVGGRWWSTGWGFVTAYPKIATVVWVVLLLYVLAVAFHAEWRWHLLSLPGIILLLLAIVGFSTFVVIKQVFWETSWITAAILMLLIISVLDYGIMKMMPADMKGHWTTILWPGGSDSTKTAGVSVSVTDTKWSTPQSTTTAECPGGIIKRTFRDVNHRERLSNHPCQVVVFIEKGWCARLYDEDGDYQGKSCAGQYTQVNGITYEVGGDDSGPVKVWITLCPLGKVTENMGSCS